MLRDTRVLLIGFGNMGQALARGWLGVGLPSAAIAVVEPDERARRAAADLGLDVGAGPEARTDVDVTVLAVKPSQLGAVLDQCRPLARPDVVFLSIAAGKTLRSMLAALGHDARVVRAMPNTPAAIRQGMTVLVAGAGVSAAQRTLCNDLLGAVGEVAWVEDEAQLDTVTAVSGSGPAYVFLLIECLEAAARELGLPEPLAKQLAIATVAGAGAYAHAANEPAAELRRHVTSPGGTTEAALAILRSKGGMADLMTRAIRAAAARSRELSSA